MPAIITDKFRLHNAEQFIEAFSEASTSNLYLFIGRPESWSNELSPPTPTDSVSSEYDSWEDMIALKKISASDVKYVVPRVDWTTGTVYTAYDHTSTTLFDSSFYVLTDDYNVYKCLFNNSGAASTTKPTGTSTNTLVTTADGYIWKYLYTISAGDALKFLTSDFMPVATDSGVAADAVDGSIQIVRVTAGGSGFTSAPNVTIYGDGANATANATITSNAVSAITIINAGEGYRNANVVISGGGGSGATGRVMISPNGGHGSNAVDELGGFYVMMNTRLEYDEGSGDFPVTNDFRRIGVVKDPETYGTGNVASISTLIASPSINVTSTSGSFTVDEYLIGSTTGANARVISTATSGSNATIRYFQANAITNYTSFQVGETVTGVSSGTTATVSSLINPEVQPNSGKIIYTENRQAITRAIDQVESIHLVVQF